MDVTPSSEGVQPCLREIGFRILPAGDATGPDESSQVISRVCCREGHPMEGAAQAHNRI
jgi:hypothetical protein